ncbi:hypothetical protein [Pedobacter antarcticus]|uniref:hypothetical protein n=1 Tax=Pedobacter antarcticus TaxID=34086 RepID=UPI0029309907|nr:hypothetical protein [Pedobacter antarcticus]
MNIRILILVLFLFVLNVHAQEKYQTIDGSSLKIEGLSFELRREVILKKFEKPLRIFEPKYECGFLSEAEQGNKYYSIEYKYFKFTGNSKAEYILEEIHFVPTMPHTITFRNKLISYKTTKKEFETIFGVKIDGDRILLHQMGKDDAFIFAFVNGRLSKLGYWSPC